MEIVFASMNPKKVEVLQRIANEYGIKLLSLRDVISENSDVQAEETGETFKENAYIKAKYWYDILKRPVIAEDSGLMIDALDGYPGVRTKRCIEELSPESNVNADNPDELYPHLLKLIEKTGKDDYTTYFFSAIAYVSADDAFISEYNLKGELCEKAGERVFGFDQYFKPEGYNKTLSEMDISEKDEIGPRKKSLVEVFNKINK